MEQPEYAILDNKDAWPMPLILHLSSPLLVGQVVQCRTEEEFLKVKKESFNRGGGAEILGYRILIVAAGCLDDYPDEQDNAKGAVSGIAGIYRGMADFYLNYRVVRHPKMFEKYKRND